MIGRYLIFIFLTVTHYPTSVAKKNPPLFLETCQARLMEPNSWALDLTFDNQVMDQLSFPAEN